MRTVTIKTFQEAPYWTDIKRLSDEDKYILISLIKDTMGKAELTSEEDELEQFVRTIPSDVIKTAAALAHEDYKEGKCIPHSQIKDYIKQEMGWN